MAFDAFLKLDGIEGESRDAKHKNEIDVLSFSWGASNPSTVSGGGGGAGKVSFQDFHFVQKVNKASPKIFLSCATGQHIKKAVLTCRKAGESQQEYLKITLENVIVTSFQQAGSAQGGEDAPLEEVSLNYSTIEESYTEIDDRGKAGGTTTARWDRKKNTGGESGEPAPPEEPSGDTVP